MPTYYEDLDTILGSRMQKTITHTVHVKDVPYGEIDPCFAQKYSDELDDQWKFFYCNYMYLVTWNRDVDQPRLTTGWTEIREHLELQYHYQLLGLVYYGDSMFHLELEPIRDSSTYGLPSFHSLSAKPIEGSLTFEIAIPTDPNSTNQLILNQDLAEYITSFHHCLLLEGPVAEPMYSPIIKSVDQDQVTTYQVDGWSNFCRENYFSNGDIVKFTFFDIENSNRVDVDWVSH
ncbi:hypothetical protein A2U01_0000818 [Trifolium medium]|uniref:TF-B3 domain-containing protein n=1 Tax=Trifolium medium TaxID=97028 RepID=A0A392LYM7_9FABA|nr:hypothetical protein [Trifolium medium]